MTNRYILEEGIFKTSTKYSNLNVNENESAILNIFRLISGTINLRDNYNNKLYKIRENHLTFPTTINSKINQKSILDNFEEEVKLADLDNYFKKARNNKKFYQYLEIELIKCLTAYNNKNFLESFFYLYRIIEGISYSIPLIYISKKTDYNKTYGSLQSFFGKDKDGELLFFRKFVCEIFKEEDYFKSDFTINLNEIEDEDLKTKYYELYLKKLKPDVVVDKEEPSFIKVKFIGFYDFMIELRNRFFHNLKGTWAENFDSSQLLYPDIFFKPITKHGLNWLCIILFEIIKFDLKQIK